MKEIVNEWGAFCRGESVYEEDYFYTLFMEEITSEEIEEIFKYFPNSEKLIDRMKRYLSYSVLEINKSNKRDILDELIKSDFNDRKPVLELLPSFSRFNLNPKFTYVESPEKVEELILDDIWIQDFHDFMRSQKIETDQKAFELNNALYGLTYDFDYQLFLFQPMLNTTYTADSLFVFKKLGGIYAITEEEVCYSFR